MPQSARLSEGRGVQSLFGQCPNRPCGFFSGASLIYILVSTINHILCSICKSMILDIVPQFQSYNIFALCDQYEGEGDHRVDFR